MEAILGLIMVLLIALALFIKTNKTIVSLSVAGLIMPAFVVHTEFFVPYQGGGASMWPIALYVGSIVGLLAALVGVGLGYLVRKYLKSKSA